MRRKIRTGGVFIAGKTRGGQLRQERFIGAVVHGVQLSPLFLRPPLQFFALSFVVVDFLLPRLEKSGDPRCDVLGADAAIDDLAVDARRQAGEEEHHFGEIERRVTPEDFEGEVVNVRRRQTVGLGKRGGIGGDFIREPRDDKFLPALSSHLHQRGSIAKVAAFGNQRAQRHNIRGIGRNVVLSRLFNLFRRQVCADGRRWRRCGRAALRHNGRNVLRVCHAVRVELWAAAGGCHTFPPIRGGNC